MSAFPCNTRKHASVIRSRKIRPGAFNPEAAKAKVPCGPLWSRLQDGETVLSSDGNTVSPEEVLGPQRKGRKFSYVTDTKYLPSIAKEVEDSDLFICEGMFEQALEATAAEKTHDFYSSRNHRKRRTR